MSRLLFGAACVAILGLTPACELVIDVDRAKIGSDADAEDAGPDAGVEDSGSDADLEAADAAG